MHGAIVAFGIRNVASLDRGLARSAPRARAGRAVRDPRVHDAALGDRARRCYHVYFHHLLPLVGGVISGHRTAYSYLPRSVAHFPAEPALARRMSDAGFVDVRWESLTLGIAAIHVGRKRVMERAVSRSVSHDRAQSAWSSQR